MVRIVTFPTKLGGGTLISRDPARKASPYAEPAFMRLFGAMDLYLSSESMTFFRQASLLVLSNPDTQWAEVAVREVDGVKYILVVPTTEQNPKKVPITRRPVDNSADIRTADDVLLSAGIAMVPGHAYKMDVALLEDEDYKWAVVANWTHAKQEAVQKSKK